MEVQQSALGSKVTAILWRRHRQYPWRIMACHLSGRQAKITEKKCGEKYVGNKKHSLRQIRKEEPPRA